MMGEKKWSIKTIDEIVGFSEDEEAQFKYIILKRNDVERLKVFLYESDVQVEIVHEKNLPNGKVRITLKKM